MKPRKDYIVLNGAQGSLDGNYIKFQIQPHMFRNYEDSPDMDMTIKLVSYSFTHDFGVAVQGGHTAIVADISNRNVYDSSSNVFMASQVYKYELVGATHTISSDSMVYSAEVSCQPFTEINFLIHLGNTEITLLAGELLDSQFVLEIEYRKKQE
jgi:hypothetical protein